MAFPTKVIPFSDACVTWLNQTYAPKVHEHDQYLTREDVVGGFDSLPDYSRTVLLLTINSASNRGLPIWKLNVPGYLHAFGCSPVNQDTAFGLSDNPQKLVDRTPYSDGKYLCYSGRSVNDGWSGSVGPCVIYAGSSTYFIITGEHMGYYITFTPCFGIPSIIAKERFVTESGYTLAVDTSDYQVNGANDVPYLIKPGTDTWNRLFDNNWKANFPDLTL